MAHFGAVASPPCGVPLYLLCRLLLNAVSLSCLGPAKHRSGETGVPKVAFSQRSKSGYFNVEMGHVWTVPAVQEESDY
ncbi:MAG: hypothetical protein ACLPTZ_11265, partial [Beijerinckiaceae bacterium]